MTSTKDYSYGVAYTPAYSTYNVAPALSDEALIQRGVEYIRLQWVDYINNVRYRVIPRKYFIKLLKSSRPGIGVTKAALGLVALTLAPGFSSSGEYLYVPDLNTFRECPYAPGHASIMGFFQEKIPSPTAGLTVPLCPRTLLKRVVDEAKSNAEVTFLLGVESEFILLSSIEPDLVTVNDSDWSCSSKLPSGTVEATVLQEIADNLQQAGIELQMYHAEAAPGQYEVVTGPLAPLEAADAVVFTRETIYNVASKHQLRATFAPRLHSYSCGSAAHTHISVHSTKSSPTSNAGSDASLAPTLISVERAFLAGLLTHLPSVCALTLPTSFSYARVLDGIWSGGTYVCWGTDNREAPIRLCGSSSATSPNRPHFEVKCVDATSSPYLAFAGLVSAGAWGVKEGLKLTSGDCSGKPVAEMSVEERRAVGLENGARLPKSISEARGTLKGNSVLRGALGGEFVDSYLAVNETLEKTLTAETEKATVAKLVKFY